MRPTPMFTLFFFNDTATTEIYTLSLHDALPISRQRRTGQRRSVGINHDDDALDGADRLEHDPDRSEEHTSELQSHLNLVCRLLLEKKKQECLDDPSRCAPGRLLEDHYATLPLPH